MEANITGFGVKSKSFLVYKAFKLIAEDMGVIWVNSFNPFTEEQSKKSGCIYIGNSWGTRLRDNKIGMSFSGTNNPIDLDINFVSGVETLKAFVDRQRVIKLTIADIEEMLGYKIEIIS